MEVILTNDVEKLGLKGEVVDVKRGYARNYLLPRRLAEVATPGRVAEIRRIDEERARHEARSADQAAEIADTLTKTVLRFEVKAGPTGALFGSVTPTDIAEELWRTRKIRVDRRKIDLDVIKRIGRFSIPVHVFEGVTAEVKTLVVPEGGELPPEEELAALEAAERAEAEAAAAAHDEALRETEAALAEEDALPGGRAAADERCPTSRTRRRLAAGRGRAAAETETSLSEEPGGRPLLVLPQRRPHLHRRRAALWTSARKVRTERARRAGTTRRPLWTTPSGAGDNSWEHMFYSPAHRVIAPRARRHGSVDASGRDGFDPAP